MAKLTKKARRLAALKGWRRRNAPRRRNAGGTSTASRTATRTATEATTTGNKTSTSTGGASTSGGNVSISVKHNPGTRVGGKGLTLRNMALVTIQRLPGGAVKISGRKMAGRRANPGYTEDQLRAARYDLKMARKELASARRGGRGVDEAYAIRGVKRYEAEVKSLQARLKR